MKSKQVETLRHLQYADKKRVHTNKLAEIHQNILGGMIVFLNNDVSVEG